VSEETGTAHATGAARPGLAGGAGVQEAGHRGETRPRTRGGPAVADARRMAGPGEQGKSGAPRPEWLTAPRLWCFA